MAVVLLLITALIIALCVCRSLILTDNIQNRYTLTKKEDSFYKTILIGAAAGNEFTLSEAELNTYINKKYCTPFKNGKSGVENLMIYLSKDKPAKLFARIYTHDEYIAVRSDVYFSIDSETSVVTAELHSAYAGEFKISDRILSKILYSVFKDNEKVTVDGTSLSVKAKYTYEIKSVDFDIYLTEFEADDGELKCRTNSLTKEVLYCVIDYLTSEEGKRELGELYGNIKDKVSDGLHLFFG